jgi:hypothetical protein
MKRLTHSWIPKVLAVAVVVMAVAVQSNTVFALSLTSLSDNMSRLTEATLSNHEIKFVTPPSGGVAAGESVTYTFSAQFVMGSVAFGDMDFATGDSNNCTTANFAEETLAAAASGVTWGATVSGQVITIISGTDTIAADRCIRLKVGTNATGGTNRITNGADDAGDTITIGGTFGDSGTISVDILDSTTPDQVNVTATVSPSITFSVSDSTIGFGSLDAADDRYATGDTSGSSATVVAHTLGAGTNATSGYVMYVMGATLTSGGNTITAPTGPTATTVGTEQFGLNLTASGGTGAVDTQYGTASQFGWGAAVSTQDNIAAATGPTATTTYSATYVGNITAVTEAGSYTTDLTYTATATY